MNVKRLVTLPSSVKAALQGELDPDQLTAPERKIFDSSLGDAMALPTPSELEFFEMLKKRGDGVGYDDQGRLVRGLNDGSVEVLQRGEASE